MNSRQLPDFSWMTLTFPLSPQIRPPTWACAEKMRPRRSLPLKNTHWPWKPSLPWRLNMKDVLMPRQVPWQMRSSGWRWNRPAVKIGNDRVIAAFLRDAAVPCRPLLSVLTVTSSPALRLPHLILGRINQDDMGEVWRRHPELQSLRKRSLISLEDFLFCRDCPYISYCTGNCPAIAYTLTGIINHPSPDACLRQFLKQGGRLPNEGVC